MTIVNNGSVYFNLTGGALAVPAGGTLQMGAGNTNQPNLIMRQSNQFGSGIVMNFANASGNYGRFDLEGTNQTLAGLNAGSLSTLGGGVVQNVGPDGTGTGTSTLTLNGGGNYLYNGYVRDEDNGTHTNQLALVYSGTGSQTVVGSQITYTGNTTVSSGTLEFYNTRAFSNGSVPSNTLSVASSMFCRSMSTTPQPQPITPTNSWRPNRAREQPS